MPDFLPYSQRQIQVLLGEIQAAIYTVITPLEITAWRTAEPVPYALFEGPCKEKTGGERGFNEVDAKATRVYLEDARKLMGRLLGK